MQRTVFQLVILTAIVIPTSALADGNEDPSVLTETPTPAPEGEDTAGTERWVASGSIGRLWFTNSNTSFSNNATETTTVRLEVGRTIGRFSLAALGQVSHVNGEYWLAQSGTQATQGDSLILQLGISGRVRGNLGPLVGSVYADITAARVPLLMDQDWYQQEVVEESGMTFPMHEERGQILKHAGLGLGGALSLPLFDTGVSADAMVGVQWITGVDLAVQTQLGMSATF